MSDKTINHEGAGPARPRRRGYSREFRPHGETGKRYLLDEIPAGLWSDARAKAKRDGVSMRAVILGLVRAWLNGSIALDAGGAGS